MTLGTKICSSLQDVRRHLPGCIRVSEMRELQVCWRMLTCADVSWRMLHSSQKNARAAGMLTYADVCWHMLTCADVCCIRVSKMRELQICACCWYGVLLRMLTYADVCWRMLTYADVCWRMLTYVCQHTSAISYAKCASCRSARVACMCCSCCWCARQVLTYADVCWRMLTYADVCWRMLTYADVCWHAVGACVFPSSLVDC